MAKNDTMATPQRDALFLSCPQEKRLELVKKYQTSSTGCLTRPGFCEKYTFLHYKKTNILAHRAVLIWQSNSLPAPSEKTRHKCHNRGCIAVAHLEFTAAKQEAQDKSGGKKKAHGNYICGTDHPSAKIDASIARQIMHAYFKTPITSAALAAKYGISAASVIQIVNKRTWARATADIPSPSVGFKTMKSPRGGSHKNHRLNQKDIPVIRQMACDKVAQKQIAQKYQVAPSCIHAVIHKKTWTHVD